MMIWVTMSSCRIPSSAPSDRYQDAAFPLGMRGEGGGEGPGLTPINVIGDQ